MRCVVGLAAAALLGLGAWQAAAAARLSVTLERPVSCALRARCLACDALDLQAAGVAQAVLQLEVGCNRPGGFAITFTSGNAGALVRTAAPHLALPYRVRLALPTLATPLVAVAAPGTRVLEAPRALFGPLPGALELVLERAATAAGDYRDRIDLTISSQ